jgi:hypothetical protein
MGKQQPGLSKRKHLSQSPYYVAVTGHRDLQNQATEQFVTLAFHAILKQVQRDHSEGIVALSALAEGADTIFAETAIELGIPLEAIMPYNRLAENFRSELAHERYLRLHMVSRLTHKLPFSEPSVQAFVALGRKLVDSCHLLVTAWDGLPAIDDGGTGGVVAYAQQQRRPVVHVHTRKRIITPILLC